MKKFILLFLAAAGGYSVSAQSSNYLADRVTGNFYRPENSTVDGSPLLFSEFVPGVIYMKDGYKADKFLLNVDLYNNELLFKHEGQSFVVVNPVKEFVLTPMTGKNILYRNGYLATDRNTENTFYQVLQDGPISLLKLTRKYIKEKKEYNQPPSKEFDAMETYYIVKGNSIPERIKKDRSSIISAIGDQNGKLEEWAKKNNNKCKTDEELIELVKAANSNQLP